MGCCNCKDVQYTAGLKFSTRKRNIPENNEKNDEHNNSYEMKSASDAIFSTNEIIIPKKARNKNSISFTKSSFVETTSTGLVFKDEVSVNKSVETLVKKVEVNLVKKNLKVDLIKKILLIGLLLHKLTQI